MPPSKKSNNTRQSAFSRDPVNEKAIGAIIRLALLYSRLGETDRIQSAARLRRDAARRRGLRHRPQPRRPQQSSHVRVQHKGLGMPARCQGNDDARL